MNENFRKIDINADVGEGMGHDTQIMPLISSCNIACGGHVGDATSMQYTIKLAKKYGVQIGAHPSFPDTDNFGRVLVTMTKSELTQSIFEQLLHFFAICEMENATIHHIKPHGALYNYAAKDAPTADAIVDAIVATKRRPVLYVPHGSVLHKKAENLLPLAFEAFIDRRYNDNLSLVSRTNSAAVIHDKQEAWKQLEGLIFKQEVRTTSGLQKSLQATTFCVHGDHPHSVEILEYIHEQLSRHQLKWST